MKETNAADSAISAIKAMQKDALRQSIMSAEQVYILWLDASSFSLDSALCLSHERLRMALEKIANALIQKATPLNGGSQRVQEISLIRGIAREALGMEES